MELNIDKAKLLLKETSTILQKQKEYLKESGEDFNIFSITKIERYENNTHSAMIAELLNPKGTHHQGTLFLEEFLKIVLREPNENEEKSILAMENISKFCQSSPTVVTEFHTGYKNYEEITGGRLDIKIETHNAIIIIENKIDAKDQEDQLKRYYEHAKSTEKEFLIFYLSKYGENASELSTNNLEAHEKYYCLGYHEEITEWLKEFTDESKNKLLNTFVRNTVKQYLNIEKIITNQLEEKFMHRLEENIKKNLVEATAISLALESTKQNIRQDFKEAVEKAVYLLGTKYNLEFDKGNSVDKKYSQIWLKPKAFKYPALYVGIESFGGNPNDNGGGCIFFGIFNPSANLEISEKLGLKKDTQNTLWWPKFEWAKNYNNDRIDLTSPELLGYLCKEDNLNSIAVRIASQLSEFLDDNINDFNNLNVKYSKPND